MVNIEDITKVEFLLLKFLNNADVGIGLNNVAAALYLIAVAIFFIGVVMIFS